MEGEETQSITAIKKDISAWQVVSIQAIGVTGTINLMASNYGGEIEGVYDGDASTLDITTPTLVQAVDISSGTSTTSIATDGIYRISPISFKYLVLSEGGADRIVLFLNKPF